MALVDTRWMVGEYTDDFGNKYKNIFFKIQPGAPHMPVYYSARPTNLICGGNIPFRMRYLEARFNDGRTLRYPVPNTGLIDNITKSLKPSLLDETIPGEGADEAACINLVGEEWPNVPASVLGVTLNFKTSPYTNIPSRGTKETGTYTYLSDIPGVGKFTLTYRIEKDPNDLNQCQKEGLAEIKETVGICSGGALGIKPRHFIINALADNSNANLTGDKKIRKVIRNVNVSGYDQNILPGAKLPPQVAQAIDKCSYCFGWKGESVRNIQNIITRDNPVDPILPP